MQKFALRSAALLLLTCLALPTMAATYRWVDQNGVVHYSDKPRQGAEEIKVQSAQTYSSAPGVARRAAGANREQDASSDQAVYQSLRVVRPAPQETYRNIGGALPVSLSLSPSLRPGDSVRVFYDGQPWKDWPQRLLSHTLSGIYRGEHNIRAEIVDANGKAVASSETVTFFVHQTSIYNRARN